MLLLTRPAACVRARFALLALVLTSACGRPPPESEAAPRRIEDPAELERLAELERTVPKPKQRWKRAASSPMPETFVAFDLPDLATLDGAWLVESDVSDGRVLWLIDEGGAALTEIDHRGQERQYSLSIASPCALRLTDARGHTRTGSLALHGDRLVVTRTGATAVRGRDGSLLACVGHRTYQIAPDGRCRYTSEMLGSWTEPTDPSERCELRKHATGPVLTLAEHRLRERDGVWLDERSDDALAIAVADRATGLAALAIEDAPSPGELAAPSETSGPTAPASLAP